MFAVLAVILMIYHRNLSNIIIVSSLTHFSHQPSLSLLSSLWPKLGSLFNFVTYRISTTN